MPQVTFDIPQEIFPDCREGICLFMGYRETIPNPDFDDTQVIDPITNPMTIPNPETKNDFAVRMFGRLIEKMGMKYRLVMDKAASRDAIKVVYDQYKVTKV